MTAFRTFITINLLLVPSTIVNPLIIVLVTTTISTILLIVVVLATAIAIITAIATAIAIYLVYPIFHLEFQHHPPTSLP